MTCGNAKASCKPARRRVHYAGIETFVEQLGERLDIREIAFD